jgi:hypothetical protein
MSLATIALCVVTTPLFAQATATETATSDPAGTWFWTQDYGQGEADHWLMINTDGEKLTGSYLSDGLDEPVAIEDGKFADGKFTFKLTVDAEGQEIEVTTTGSVTGDEMSAVSEFEVDGTTQEADLDAIRKTRPEDVVGTWNLEIEAEGQVFEPVAKVTQDGDQLKVEYLTDEFGDHEAIDVELKDNKLAYTIAVESPEGAMKLVFNTMPAGDKVTGTVDYEVGDITGSADVTGSREPAATDIVGTWNLTADAEGQTFEPTMKVTRNDDGELTVEYLTDEFGDHEAVDVKLDGDKLTFMIAVESPEGAMKLMFDTKIDGNKISGKVDYEVGDITGSTDIEGEKE